MASVMLLGQQDAASSGKQVAGVKVSMPQSFSVDMSS